MPTSCPPIARLPLLLAHIDRGTFFGYVMLAASLTVIDSSAFVTSEVKSTVFIVTPGSYAEEYCTSRGLKIKYAE